MADLHSWLSLSMAPGLGPVLLHRLLAAFGEPAAVLAASEKDLCRVPGVGHAVASGLKPDELAAAADKQLEQAARQQVTILHIQHDAYPELLRHIYRPPVVLFVKGDIELLCQAGVAIVGSRAATVYGRKVAAEFGAALAREGLVVISGVALGIDGAAHSGALTTGKTIGVLGCGLDVVYPRQHRHLYGEISQHGALVTENPFGTSPEPFRFPARNRIISGLSLGVVVVEAAQRSGSLITAGLALDQGREVFAVPGRIDSGKSSGVHKLLQDGALLVSSADEILAELRGGTPVDKADNSPEDVLELSRDEKKVYGLLDVYGLSIDEIIQLSGMRAEKVAEILLLLELKDAINSLPGNVYQVVNSSD